MRLWLGRGYCNFSWFFEGFLCNWGNVLFIFVFVWDIWDNIGGFFLGSNWFWGIFKFCFVGRGLLIGKDMIKRVGFFLLIKFFDFMVRVEFGCGSYEVGGWFDWV